MQLFSLAAPCPTPPSPPTCSTHSGSGTCTRSPTFPPHAWNDSTACSRSPVGRSTSSSCR
jgi:hypothetical protein